MHCTSRVVDLMGGSRQKKDVVDESNRGEDNIATRKYYQREGKLLPRLGVIRWKEGKRERERPFSKLAIRKCVSYRIIEEKRRAGIVDLSILATTTRKKGKSGSRYRWWPRAYGNFFRKSNILYTRKVRAHSPSSSSSSKTL